MTKVYHWKELKFVVDGLSATIEKLEKLQQKVEHLPHQAELGDSLQKINHKFEVVKLKNEIGTKQITYEGLVIILNKYKNTLQQINEHLRTIDGAIGNLTLHTANWEIVKKYFDNINIKYLIGALNDPMKWIYQLNDKSKTWIQKISQDKKIWLETLQTAWKEHKRFTWIVGINQNPNVTGFSPFVVHNFDAVWKTIDSIWGFYEFTEQKWIKHEPIRINYYHQIKTSEFSLESNVINLELKAPINKENDSTTNVGITGKHNIFEIKGELNELIIRHQNPSGTSKKYNTTWEKIIEKVQEPKPPSLREVLFSQEVYVKKRTFEDISETGNTVKVFNLNDLIRNTGWVGNTLQFHFVYCGGKDSTLHGNQNRYKVKNIKFLAEKLPALDVSTWRKKFKMDVLCQWILGNKGELKTDHQEDCVEGAPTVELKLAEVGGYYLEFNWTGYKRWWNDQTINFSQPSLWDTFKIVADIYKPI